MADANDGAAHAQAVLNLELVGRVGTLLLDETEHCKDDSERRVGNMLTVLASVAGRMVAALPPNRIEAVLQAMLEEMRQVAIARLIEVAYEKGRSDGNPLDKLPRP